MKMSAWRAAGGWVDVKRQMTRLSNVGSFQSFWFGSRAVHCFPSDFGLPSCGWLRTTAPRWKVSVKPPEATTLPAFCQVPLNSARFRLIACMQGWELSRQVVQPSSPLSTGLRQAVDFANHDHEEPAQQAHPRHLLGYSTNTSRALPSSLWCIS